MEGSHVEEYNFVWKLLGQMLHPQRKALPTVSTQSLDPGALPPGRGMLHNGIPPSDNFLRILFKHFFSLFLTFLKIPPPPLSFFSLLHRTFGSHLYLPLQKIRQPNLRKHHAMIFGCVTIQRASRNHLKNQRGALLFLTLYFLIFLFLSREKKEKTKKQKNTLCCITVWETPTKLKEPGTYPMSRGRTDGQKTCCTFSC